MQIDLNWLHIVLTIALPIVVALATARVAHPGVKATVLAALAAIGGLLNELYAAGGNTDVFDWSNGFANAAALFLTAVGAHFGLLAPVRITGSQGAIQEAMPRGVGGSAPVTR